MNDKIIVFEDRFIYLSIPKYTIMATTIKLDFKTKKELDSFREYKNESYDEVLNKLIYIIKNLKKNPELSKETIKSIELARERIKKGDYISEKDALKRLGF